MLTLAALMGSYQVWAGPVTERYSAANTIQFAVSEETKTFVGSAFLLQHQKNLYAVTAKHVLMAVMDQGIQYIDVANHVKQWQLHPFNEVTGTVTLGRLINADATEKLDMEVLKDDWLLFEVNNNDAALKPVQLASEPLKAGDQIHVFGCYYQVQDSCQQEHFTGVYLKHTDHNLLVRLDDVETAQLRGLSGAPVLNDRHEVVGIVSNTIPGESGELLFAPFDIRPLAEYLKRL
ncbi:trypsin-like peptidase domain-containing protein [Marinicella sediminis]|nr:trypsin-like peptidase domain-containing protein [Marinicella sediminis]